VLREDTSKINFLNDFVAKHFPSDPNRCLLILEHAQNLSDQVEGFRDYLIAYNSSISYYQLSLWDSVIFYGQRALLLTDSLSERSLYGKILGNLATTMRTIGREEESNNYRLRSRHHYEQAKDTLGLAIIDNDLGLHYYNLGQYTRSLDHFQKSLKGLELKNYASGVAIVLNNIGMIIHQQKDYETARSYYRKSFQKAREINSQQNMGSTLNNIGSSYQDEGLLDSALHYHRISLEIQEKVSDFGSMAATYNNFGIIYAKKKDYPEAIKNHHEAIKYARQARDIQTEADATIKLGQVEKAMGKTDVAIKDLQRGLSLAKKVKSMQLQQEANQALYELYRPRTPIMSLSYLEEATQLRDSLLNEEKIRELAIKEKEYEFESEKIEKEKEIALLNANAQLQEMRLTRNKRNLSILLVAIVLLAFFTRYIYLNRKKIKALNRDLRQQKQLLEAALSQKEMLLKEIHHRVKNNLQVVSSLLGIQSRQVKDQAALDAIKAGRARVHSMAIIHQDLYRNDHPTGIEVRSYFKKLVYDLLDTYDITKDKISLSSDIDEIILDVDTIIPMGLILNELITNSLKYAFPKGKGSIHVQIKETDEGLLLRVKDDGIGLTDTDTRQGDSFGYDLIESLIENLEGEWSRNSKQGTEVNILLKNYKKAA
jgi:two-component sensor histidine kinase